MPTIAEQLGTTPHLSPLLRKLKRLGLGNPEDMRQLAVKRGCTHFRQSGDNLDAVPDPGNDQLPDIELAFAMISASQSFDTRRIRTAVELLSSVDEPPNEIVRLANTERCQALIRHVAQAGVQRDEEKQGFWQQVLDGVAHTPLPPEGRLPHPSRYYLESGILPRGKRHGRKRAWLRRGT